MDLESIRKIWTILGTLVALLGSKAPVWLVDILGPTGTELVFAVVGAAVALFQFVKSRTGKDKPAELNANPVNTTVYMLNPFKAA